MRNADGTFPKGSSGNPNGRRKKKPVDNIEVSDMALIPGAHADSWFSQQTGMGTQAHDRRLSHHQRPSCLSYQDCLAIWSTDDLGRRGLQDPVEDAFRPGYRIEIREQGDFDDLVEDVTDRAGPDDLRVDEYLTRAVTMERAVGGSAILLGVRDHRPMNQPVVDSEVRGLDWMSILEPIELTPYDYYTSPDAGPKYGKPKHYLLTGFTTVGAYSGGSMVDDRAPPPDSVIHESRLLIFNGIKVSRYQWAQNALGSLWGESMTSAIHEPLRDVSIAFAAAAVLATEVGQPTLTIDNLMTLIATKPKELAQRLAAINNGRATNRMVVLATGETLEHSSSDHLAGVPELLNMLAIRYAAAIPMPLSRLMGQAPKALGNESDAETAFYHADIANLWRTKIAPPLKRILWMIMRGERTYKLPKSFRVRQNDLKQLSDDERATLHLTQARTDSMYIKSGVVTPNEIRRSRFGRGYSLDTTIDPKQKAPGFLATPPGGTPGSATNPGPAALNSHPVGGYTRKNPAQSGTEPAAKQGGDVIPGAGPNAKKDARPRIDAQSELEYQIARRSALEADKTLLKLPGARELIDQLVAASAEEWSLHQMGACDPEDCLLPHDEDCGSPQEEAAETPEEEQSAGMNPGDGPGNFVSFQGFPVVIENPAGSVRAWGQPDGVHGETQMKFAYGYIYGSTAQDGDSVDVYLGPDETTRWVFIVHQQKAPDFEEYDESKVMLGFPNAASATEAYTGQYDDPRFFGGMTQMSVEAFRKKIQIPGKVTA